MSNKNWLADGLAPAVEKATPTLVRVAARKRLPATGIIWSADGVIMTANHVVQTKKIKVGLPDGAEVTASVIGRDPSTDLALLRAEASDLPVPPTAVDDSLKVGHFVLALGRPGRGVQATWGIISALGDSWRTGAGGVIDRFLQTDVLMYPGFSGGALVNTAGELIGLNTSALSRGSSLTIPVATLNRLADTLLTHGKVKKGYLGISTQTVRLPQTLAEEIGQETGLLIASVEPGSPAEEGGLLLGDTIVQFGDTAVRHHDDLLALLRSTAVGQKSPVKIVRGGQVQELTMRVGEKS